MSRLASERDALHQHIQFLYLCNFIMLIVAAALWYGWKQSPKNIRVSLPPDLRHGAVVKPGEYAAATIQAFAFATFREFNRWEEDGAADYGNKIFAAQAYLTPRYRSWLVKDMEDKAQNGELQGRSRYMLELDGVGYDSENVQSLDDGSWLVHLKVIIVESIGSIEAKRVSVHYPMRVVKMNVSPQRNIWGLALDGYPSGMEEKLIEDLEENDV